MSLENHIRSGPSDSGESYTEWTKCLWRIIYGVDQVSGESLWSGPSDSGESYSNLIFLMAHNSTLHTST